IVLAVVNHAILGTEPEPLLLLGSGLWIGRPAPEVRIGRRVPSKLHQTSMWLILSRPGHDLSGALPGLNLVPIGLVRFGDHFELLNIPLQSRMTGLGNQTAQKERRQCRD